MSTTVHIHDAEDAIVSSFQPSNNMAITIRANGVDVTYFGMPPVLAWSLFDMMRTGATSFHFGDESVFRLQQADPQAAAALIARARAETLPVEEAA